MLNNTMRSTITNEPILTWATIASIFNALQLLVIPFAPWLHVVIVAITVVASALAARSKTVPAGNSSKIAKALGAFSATKSA